MGQTDDAFVGRDSELAQLVAALDDIQGGACSFFAVTGEAGIGKTRLLREFADVASERNCLTVAGRASEFERDYPFGLFVDALDSYLATLDERLLERLAMDRLGALAAVFPSMHSIDYAVDRPGSTTERFVVHHAVRDLIERLATGRPVVIVLDDLQWADGASLELVASLIRRPPQAPALIVVTVRTGHGDAATLQLLRAVQQMSTARTIELGPLDPADLANLLQTPAQIDIDRLHHQSGGNPFYAIQLARSPTDEDGPGRNLDGSVPAAVVRAITAELEWLSVPARAFAEGAGVVGDPFEIELASSTAQMDEQLALAQLDELIARDLIRATGVPRRFQFRHPLVRAAVYEATPPGSRLRYHQAAARALTAMGRDAATVAPHVEQSARIGDDEAIAILTAAGNQALHRAPATAARWFSAVLRLLPADAPTGDRVGTLISMAGSLAAIGRFDEARAALELCIDLTDAFGTETWAQLVVGCAGLDQLLGEHHRSRHRLLAAYGALTDPASSGGVALLLALSSSCFFSGDFEGVSDWAERAVSASIELGDENLRAESLAAQTLGAAWAGHIAVARELHAGCIALVDQMDDDQLRFRLNALTSLASAELYLDLFAESCTHGERCLELARATEQTQLIPALVPILGSSLWVVGEMERSATLLDESIDAARLVGNTQAISLSLFDRSLSALMAGDLDTALTCGRESVELAETFDRGLVSVYAGAMYALALLESGDFEGAYDALLASGGGHDLSALAGSWRSMYLEALTRCCLELDRRDEAMAAADQALAEADALDLILPRLMAWRAQAAVASANGESGRALALARSALGAATELGSPIFIASTYELAGRMAAADDRQDEAVALLTVAATEFDALGATRYKSQVERELRRLGQKTTTRHRPGDGSRSGLLVAFGS